MPELFPHLRVTVIDDERFNGELLATMCRSLGAVSLGRIAGLEEAFDMFEAAVCDRPEGELVSSANVLLIDGNLTRGVRDCSDGEQLIDALMGHRLATPLRPAADAKATPTLQEPYPRVIFGCARYPQPGFVGSLGGYNFNSAREHPRHLAAMFRLATDLLQLETDRADA